MLCRLELAPAEVSSALAALPSGETPNPPPLEEPFLSFDGFCLSPLEEDNLRWLSRGIDGLRGLRERGVFLPDTSRAVGFFFPPSDILIGARALTPRREGDSLSLFRPKLLSRAVEKV